MNDMNITVKPVGGLGRELEPRRMTFPSSAEIKPRLRTFFLSHFIIVEAGQSPGHRHCDGNFRRAPLRCTRCDLGSDTAGSGAIVDSGVFLLHHLQVHLEGETILKNGGDDTVAMRKKSKGRIEAVKEKNGRSKFFLLLYKRGVTKEIYD
jgi:hypothetical protein